MGLPLEPHRVAEFFMWSEPAFHDDQRIVDLWRGWLVEARKEYHVAVGESKTAGADFTAGTLPSPDGSQHMVNTLRAETEARNEYMRVLMVFTDLVLRGKKPETEL
jgi:hypothetical protein